MTNDCIFCSIIAGNQEEDRVFENDDFIVIEDISQVTPGHMLLIPKEHSDDILSMKTQMGVTFLEVVQKIGHAMMDGLGAKGFNLFINTKPAAGQIVFHTHVHLIPRYDEKELQHWTSKKTSADDRAIYAQKIIMALD